MAFKNKSKSSLLDKDIVPHILTSLSFSDYMEKFIVHIIYIIFG